MRRLLRCYAEGRADDWEAICLDLDVAVQGSSLDEVIRELNAAVLIYLETLNDLPSADRKRLFRRRAPLLLRLKFLWHAFLDLFRRGDGDGDGKERAEYTCYVPA